MKESNSETVAADEELKRQYENSDDLKAAHSVLMRQLFKTGEQKAIENRIAQIKNQGVQNQAFFNFALMNYEIDGNLDKALELADKIKFENERTRCLVHLAIKVLNAEADIEKAEKIARKIKEDPQNYLKYFEREKQRISEIKSDF